MPGWTSVDTHPTHGRTFQRHLDCYEHSFFLEGLFNGHTDILRYYELRLLNGARGADLFSDANIVRSWMSTKRRYPLAATIVQRHGQGLGAGTDSNVQETNGDGSSTQITRHPHFIVRESDLSVPRPQEIVFGYVNDAGEVQQREAAILGGPRLLTDESLVQLHVFRETASETARPDVLHVMVLMSHCVADGTACRMFVRCFVDTLARGTMPEPEPAQMPLEERLAMAIPVEELEPVHLRTLSPAIRRWRNAVAVVIIRTRFEKKQGGHTLPCHRTPSTRNTTARSGLVETSLTQAQTTAVISKCRQHKITFGNAYLVLSQVAMTRVLYRRYLRGEISEEEWAYRKRQPHINDGPINARSYVDKLWFESGGGGEFVVSLTGYTFQLPFMTLGRMDHEHHVKQAFPDGAPPFSDLLTFDRFLHRAMLAKKQAAAALNHPLFFEMMCAVCRMYLHFLQLSTQSRMESDNHDGNSDEGSLAVMDIPSISAHAGSSFGNMDPIFPFEYPIPPTHALSPYSPAPHPLRAGYATTLPSTPLPSEADTIPTIAIECERTHLQARPGELNLNALTWRGQMKMYVIYDRNVFEERVVREWLEEIKGAMLWYLH